MEIEHCVRLAAAHDDAAATAAAAAAAAGAGDVDDASIAGADVASVRISGSSDLLSSSIAEALEVALSDDPALRDTCQEARSSTHWLRRFVAHAAATAAAAATATTGRGDGGGDGSGVAETTLAGAIDDEEMRDVADEGGDGDDGGGGGGGGIATHWPHVHVELSAHMLEYLANALNEVRAHDTCDTS